MGRRRAKPSATHTPRAVAADASSREKDHDTIRTVNRILDSSPVDVVQLRKVAAVRGLGSNAVRARAWPYLLGVDPSSERTAHLRMHDHDTHRDSRTVEVDVARSLFNLLPGATPEHLALRQSELKRVITAVVASHPDVHYYQGLHDVAGVLVLVLGEHAAYVHLDRLVQHHLRDFTRSNLNPVLNLLKLLPVLLACTDPELAAFIERSGCPPFHAIAGLITWHTHECHDLVTAARLFDLFLTSTPLLPLYLTAELLRANRAKVLAVDCDLSAVHQALQATRLPTRNGLDQLAHRALALTRERSPAALATLGGFRLPGECAASAFPFPYMQQSAQAQDRLAQAAAASTSDSTPSNKRAAPAPHSVPPSTPRPPRMPCTLRDKPQLQQLRCACRLCSDRTGKEPIDNWELSAPRWRIARVRRLLRASAAAAVCALGAMVVQIAFEAPDAADSLLERWIESFTGDIL